jgi:hypothetical protein
MPNNSSKPKARKRRDDKLDWEALETAPNVDGMFSYLRNPPAGARIVAINAPPTAAESITEPGSDLPGSASLPGESLPGPAIENKIVTREPGSDLPGSVLPGSVSLPGQSLPGTQLPHAKPPAAWFSKATDATFVPGFGKRRVHRCVLVQDAHTPGEQALLSTFYRIASFSPGWGGFEPDGSCTVSISLPELARQAAMHKTNVRNNVRSLVEKLAIEVTTPEDSKAQVARCYRVYSYKQILERRRSAGLEWVIKNRGVTFLRPDEVASALSNLTNTTGSASPGSDYPGSDSPGSETLRSDLPGSETLPPSLLVNSKSISRLVKPTTTAVHLYVQIATLIRGYGHEPDQRLLERLADGCIRNAIASTGEPATIDEIAYFTDQKLKTIARDPNIRSPLALLATVVPRCFEGESFRLYREAERKRKTEEAERDAAAQAELAAWRREQESILADPNASEEERELARQVLGL